MIKITRTLHKQPGWYLKKDIIIIRSYPTNERYEKALQVSSKNHHNFAMLSAPLKKQRSDASWIEIFCKTIGQSRLMQ